MTAFYSEFEGLDGVAEFAKSIPAINAKAARLAINQTAERGGLKLARQSILDEIAFPKDYLNASRLGVTKRATDASLEAVITGRKRATSLARFAAPGTPIGNTGGSGVRVRVKAGKSTVIRRAWLVRLKAGASLTEDNYNVGFALRVNPGEKIANKRDGHSSWLVPGSVALLYAPSVDQVFRDVANDIAEPLAAMTSAEFLRQFTRLSR